MARSQLTQLPDENGGEPLEQPDYSPSALNWHGISADIDHIGSGNQPIRTPATQLVQTTFSMPPQTSLNESLVGFRREFAHLEKMIRDARAGRCAVAGIHGLAGSGKSFLVETMVAQASGFTVVRLPAPSGDDAPVDSWQKAFQLAEDRGQSAAASKRGADEGDQLQSLLTTAIRATCRRTASPALLVFDGCHPSQTELAEAVAGAVLDPELGVTAILVLTWRDEPDGSTLSFTQPFFPSHKLQPLTLEQSADFLATRIGKLPEPAVLSELWRSTGGNPWAMLSACSSLSDEELNGMIPFPDPVPMGAELAEAFGKWAEPLEGDARLALTIAAAAWMPLPILEDALAQADLDIATLRPATDLGTIAIVGDRLDFAHPLCRAAAFQQADAQSRHYAREMVSRAYARAGQPERAAIQAALSADARDDSVASLCEQASQVASQRSDPDAAARYEVLGARFAQSQQRAARHLIRASALWQAAGRPERAMECLRRVTPVSSSTAILGQVTYRAGRIAFASEAAAQSPAQMAAGAEACAETEPDDAVAMLADAAASAVLTDQLDEALRYAGRAVEIAGGQPGVIRDMARVTLNAITTLASDAGSVTESHDIIARVMNTQGMFVGSPQLAYVLGVSLQIAPPALIGRWFAWMSASVGLAQNRSIAAAVAMVRSKERLDSGHVAAAITASETAVIAFDAVRDRPLLARALGWRTYAQASAGDVTGAFETASKFFALESAMTHSARLQVLAALAHCELQRGHVDRAAAWLRAFEDESVARDSYQECTDWPSLPVFLQLALLAEYEPTRINTAISESGLRGSGAWPRHLLAWNEGLRQSDPTAALRHLDETFLSGPERSPILNAQIKLTSALMQRQLGSTQVARFNFTQASNEFDRCGAHGWSTLATSRLERQLSLAGGSAPATPVPTASATVAPAAPPYSVPSLRAPEMEPPGEGVPASAGQRPAYEIRLLGQFSVSRDGVPADIPLGHAAQALKVVALFRRISVDELAELLWPGAEPGVGTRRLRNILWRIKSSSGDLLRRYDNFICLEDDVVTDAAVFEEAAGRAFNEDVPLESGHALAREAIRLYGGELLPSDRYADWTTGPREALTQLRLQLLDLMLAHASEAGNRQEAFSLLEELIDADPFEERYYMQLATLHLEAGNRSRMRASLSRGERMLADLGVEPSKSFVDLAERLQHQR